MGHQLRPLFVLLCALGLPRAGFVSARDPQQGFPRRVVNVVGCLTDSFGSFAPILRSQVHLAVAHIQITGMWKIELGQQQSQIRTQGSELGHYLPPTVLAGTGQYHPRAKNILRT